MLFTLLERKPDVSVLQDDLRH